MFPKTRGKERVGGRKDVALRVTIFSVVALLISGAVATTAWADLIFKGKDGKVVPLRPGASCGPGNAAGRDLQYTVTDKAGNTFKMECVDKTYLEGTITTPGVAIPTPFGRCVFDVGANILKFETKADNTFKEIDWVNVKPKGATDAARVASRDQINKDLNTSDGETAETTGDWITRVKKYLKDNTFDGPANNRQYRIAFSPLDQEIGFFLNETRIVDAILSPEQARAAYLPNGESPIPDLQIDPAMRRPDTPGQQQSAPIPEPPTYLLFVTGLLALLYCDRRRRKRAA
jgi:hypothetical protein